MQKQLEKLKIHNKKSLIKKKFVSKKSHSVISFSLRKNLDAFSTEHSKNLFLSKKPREILFGSFFSLTRLNYHFGNPDLVEEISKGLKKQVKKKFFKRFLKKQVATRTNSMVSLAKLQASNVSVVQGILHFKLVSRNNSVATLTDIAGNVKVCCSGGLAGFKGSNKSTKYAKDAVIQQIISKAKSLGYSKIIVHFNGTKLMRLKIVRLLRKAKIRVVAVNILTRPPHNGCRAKKVRRL
jgi:small subunit ribosomal protein S11